MTTRNLNKVVNSLSDAQKNALAHLSVIGGTVEEVDMNKYDGKVSAWQRQEWDDKAGYKIRQVLNEVNPMTWTSLNKKGLVSGTRREGGYNRWSHTQNRDKMQSLQLTPLGYRIGDMLHQEHAVQYLNSRTRRLAARLLIVQKVASGEWEFVNPEDEIKDFLGLDESAELTIRHPYNSTLGETDYNQFTLQIEFKYGIKIGTSSRPYVPFHALEDNKATAWERYVEVNGIYTVEVQEKNPLYTGYNRALNTPAEVMNYAHALIEAQRVCDMVNGLADRKSGLITKWW